MTITTRLIRANNININVAETGNGPPLLLLHGWPEFSFTWAKIMPLLAPNFRLIAPDLRGFGATDKTPAGYSDKMTADQHAEDLEALLDARITKFLAFDCPYPGIGRRWIEGGQMRRSWYMWFHQTKLALELVGHSRETIAIYMRYCLIGGSVNKQAFDDNFDAFVDNMAAPGNLQGGFNWYISHAKPVPPPSGPITIPTKILWPERDAVFPVAWMDRLPEYFTNLDASIFPGVGHFPHQEAPDRAAAEIAKFFMTRP